MGADLNQMRKTVQVVSTIYDANYQFATPPPLPTVQAYAGDGFVNLTWNNASEDAFDPITNTNDFEGYKIYRSTDESFLDPAIIYDGRGIDILLSKPLAVFDLDDGILDFSSVSVEGLQFYLGDDSGIYHTFKDTTVTNGQRYFYAVTAYDRGIEQLNIFPSESPISVNQTLRGGIILPKNVAIVYPNAQAPGYRPGTYTNLEHVQGYGQGRISIDTPNPDLIPHNHKFEIRFKSPQDSIKANSYELYDVTTGVADTVFVGGNDLKALGKGPVGNGMLPVIFVPPTLAPDTLNTGFLPNSNSNLVFRTRASATTTPPNAKRNNYPADYLIIFSDVVLDTSIGTIGVPPVFTKFKIMGLLKDGGEFQADFRFYDPDGNQTMSRHDEYIEILGKNPNGLTQPWWKVSIDTIYGPKYENSIFPTEGDVYQLTIAVPYNENDVYTFVTDSSFIDLTKQSSDYANEKPYVVPNPYLGMASFEQAPYAQTGRGDRRIEFRALPVNSTVRIYTVTGELVQTLHQDTGFQDYIAWNLRSKDNLEVAPGLYIFHVEAPGEPDFIGKFAIIK
jgi:hypothetical protein